MTYARDHCDRCKDKGLILVRYQSGEPDDIAVCECRAGKWWLKAGKRFIRQRMQLAPGQRVARLKDFEEPKPDMSLKEWAER